MARVAARGFRRRRGTRKVWSDTCGRDTASGVTTAMSKRRIWTGCSTRCWPNVGSSAAWRSTMSSFRPCRRSRTDGTSLASGGGSASPVGLPRRIPVTFHGTPRPRYVLPPRMISRQSLVSPQWRSSFGRRTDVFSEGGPPDLAIVRANHEELFALGAVHFLASVEAEPVGLLTLLRASRFAPICAEDAPFVSTTATDARYRGKGDRRSTRCRRPGVGS